MKKTVFIILAGLAAAVSAQGFVRIDTLYTPYFDFDYEGWIADSTHPLLVFAGTPCIPMGPYTGPLSTHPHPIYADRLEYNYIEGGADIYGIAVYTLFFTPEGIDPNTYPFLLEYLYLYEAQTDTLEELAAIPFDNTDSVAYLGLEVDQIPGQWANPAFYCDDHHYRRFGSRFYRYNFFFDKPIHVEDSFYVGSSSNNAHYWPNPDDTISRDHQLFWGVLSTDGLSNDGIIRYDSTCWMPPRNCKLRIKRNPYTVDADSTSGSRYGLQVEKWCNFASHEFFLILPILRTFDTIWTVDTPACTPVHDLGIMSRFGDTITLRWSHDGSHDEWQLSYGPQGIHPDNTPTMAPLSPATTTVGDSRTPSTSPWWHTSAPSVANWTPSATATGANPWNGWFRETALTPQIPLQSLSQLCPTPPPTWCLYPRNSRCTGLRCTPRPAQSS